MDTPKNNSLRGLILAGGEGTRLRPATYITNKHLIPILNQPMILYPLSTLIHFGCKDIMIVSGGNHIGAIAEFLGDGSAHGVNFTYKVQAKAGGIAQAIGLAEDFANKNNIMVVLGDNVFENKILPAIQNGKPQIWTRKVDDPQRFGVMNTATGLIEEKPVKPMSDQAVTGLYHYDRDVFDIIRTLKPSKRGELEVTDINNAYLKKKSMNVAAFEGFWSDAGTVESLARVTAWASAQLSLQAKI